MLNSLIGIIASSGGGVANSYDSIATTTVGAGGASSITFSSIPATYTHLQIRVNAHTTRTTSGVGGEVYAAFNSDTGNNYAEHALWGNGSSAAARVTTSTYPPLIGRVGTDAYGAAYFGSLIIDVLDYGNTNKNKTVKTLAGYDGNGSGEIWFTSTLWNNTNAITSMTISSNFNFTQYSSFALYGIKG
jgi:hypothetical protein